MTSGTTSPTPNESPTLSHRPLLTSRDPALRTKKSVEFQTIYKGDEDNRRFNEKWDQDK